MDELWVKKPNRWWRRTSGGIQFYATSEELVEILTNFEAKEGQLLFADPSWSPAKCRLASAKPFYFLEEWARLLLADSNGPSPNMYLWSTKVHPDPQLLLSSSFRLDDLLAVNGAPFVTPLTPKPKTGKLGDCCVTCNFSVVHRDSLQRAEPRVIEHEEPRKFFLRLKRLIKKHLVYTVRNEEGTRESKYAEMTEGAAKLAETGAFQRYPGKRIRK